MISLLKTIAVFILLTVMNGSAFCAGGSAYSRFGVGEIRYFVDERSGGMGGAAAALLGSTSINTLNPAAWTQLSRVRFSLGALYEGYASRDGSNSSFLSSAGFNGFAFAVPISAPQGLVISAGLLPYSSVGFNVVSHVDETSFTYDLKQSGEGGLSAAYLGLSAAFGDWHFGTKFNYLFGTLHHNTSQAFSSSQFTSAEVDRATHMNGVSITFGAVYTGLGKLLQIPESHALLLGAVVTTKARLTTIQENFYEYSLGGSVIARDSVTAVEGTSSLPLALGVGISYTVSEKIVLAADLFYQNWNQFTLLGSHPPELRDSYRISVGGELLPRKEISAAYLERTAYRAGLFYHVGNLRIAGTGINEIGIAAGVGLPMFAETRFNIGIEYSIRGTVDFEKDDIFRVSFTLNTGELWFVRPPEE